MVESVMPIESEFRKQSSNHKIDSERHPLNRVSDRRSVLKDVIENVHKKLAKDRYNHSHKNGVYDVLYNGIVVHSFIRLWAVPCLLVGDDLLKEEYDDEAGEVGVRECMEFVVGMGGLGDVEEKEEEKNDAREGCASERGVKRLRERGHLTLGLDLNVWTLLLGCEERHGRRVKVTGDPTAQAPQPKQGEKR